LNGAKKMDNDFIMNKINESIKEVFKNYKGLYLYGSRAKHTEKPDSDYDLVILLEKRATLEERYSIIGAIGRLEYELNIFMDTRFLTEEEMKKESFFYREVVNYGKFYAV
jgi:predicted nucleotidyltransferase